MIPNLNRAPGMKSAVPSPKSADRTQGEAGHPSRDAAGRVETNPDPRLHPPRRPRAFGPFGFRGSDFLRTSDSGLWASQPATAASTRRGFLRGLAGLLALGIMAAIMSSAADNSLIAPGAAVEKLAGDCKFTEGPTCDAAGNVSFTDQPNDRILKWSVEGRLSTFLQPAGRANGMCFDARDNLIACADEKTELWSITPDGQHTVLAKEYRGKRLNGPNDVWVRPDGGLYFTDPFYKRPWWDWNQMPQDGQHVYFLSPDRQDLKRVVDDLRQPNGIIGTPDGKTLYVADIGAKKTYRFAIQPDGTLSNKTLFCELGSDGMTLDAEGNVYLTGRGVSVFDKTGKKIEQIDVPENWTANVCFGGKDKQTLFMTASKGLYSIRLRVKGAQQAK
jgi:gluconolactonase